jgi:hypothetical protein
MVPENHSLLREQVSVGLDRISTRCNRDLIKGFSPKMADYNAVAIAPRFVTVATAWGTTHGRVNAFNYDFTIGLAREVGQPVACILPGALIQQTADALTHNVQLLSGGDTAAGEFAAGMGARILAACLNMRVLIAG